MKSTIRLPLAITGIIFATSLSITPITARTVTINPDGSISAPAIGQILGETTATKVITPAMQAIKDELKLKEQEVYGLYKSGTISLEEARARKLTLREEYHQRYRDAQSAQTQTANQEQVKTQTQEKTTKSDEMDRFTPTSARVKVETAQGNQLNIMTKTQEGIDQTVATEEELIIEPAESETDQAAVSIRAANSHKYLITGTQAAKLNTPISIDLETREMTITTPAGTRTVAVLPEAAIRKAMAAANFEEVSNATWPKTAYPESETEATLELTLENDQPVYRIPGKTRTRLLGLIPMLIQKTAVVSAETGEVITIEQPLINRLLSLITF